MAYVLTVGRSRVSELTGHGQLESLEVVWPADRQDVFSFVGRVIAVLLFLVVITDCFFLFTGARYCIIFLFEKFKLVFGFRISR